MGFFGGGLGGLGGALGGLFSGGKVGGNFLPSNSIVNSYGIDQGSLFRIKMSAYKNTEVKLSTQGGNVKVDSKPATSAMAEFEVLHNAESLTISHDHKWNGEGMLHQGAKLFNQGLMGLKGKDVINFLKGASNLVNRGSAQVATGFNAFSSVDVAKIYNGNTPPTFTVRFVLLATSDPLLEVVLPSIIFTYLSYPRLSNEGEVSNFIQNLDSNNAASLGGIFSNAGQTTGKVEATQQQAQSKLKQMFKAVKDVTQGKWRFRVGHAPPFWKVSSSNGLVHMANCHISNITTEFFGPWVEAPNHSALDGFANGNSGIGLDPTSVFPSSTQLGGLGDVLGSLTSKNLGGYPTYANINITFQHALENMFGEEWLLSLTGASNHFGATSSLS